MGRCSTELKKPTSHYNAVEGFSTELKKPTSDYNAVEGFSTDLRQKRGRRQGRG